MSDKSFVCSVCGEEKVSPDSGGTGYGIDNSGKKVCYDCCAQRDIADMTATGRITLYLTVAGPGAAAPNWPVVTNWPGTLKLPVKSRSIGNHNFAGKREDVWFVGPDGRNWHGVCIGHNTQLCHCKRLKSA